MRILGAALLFLALADPLAAAELRIEQAWLREPPPGPGTLAIYLQLFNDGPAERVLDGARVTGAKSAAVHTHEMADGLMRMRPAGPLPVSAGGKLLLEPGGHHLMVFGMEPLPRAGARLPFCLHFSDGAEACAEAVVRGTGE
jgi:copper(I)-binding protein